VEVKYERWDGFIIEKSDIGVNQTTHRKKYCEKQVSLQEKYCT
jgi:hypothetical protein